jgi:hypothetical protein
MLKYKGMSMKKVLQPVKVGKGILAFRTDHLCRVMYQKSHGAGPTAVS